MNEGTNHELDRLFYPRSIAVVGASPGKSKFWNNGSAYIAAAVAQEYSGKLYPVHPKAETTLGFKTYASLSDIPDDIDLAIFTVPVKAALPIMEECAEKGVKFVHLLTAGFSETGRPEDAELEKQLVQSAKKGGVRIVGPNCMGLYCPEGGISWNRGFPTEPGPVGFFSQSGQLASHVVVEGAPEGLTFSKAVSFGNSSDLQAHDFLEYLAQDPKTGVIGAYLEGIKDGRAFFEAAKRVTRKKPLVIWKGGQTEGGSRATQSHTAAIAGTPQIWEALCRQTGIIPTNSMQETISTIVALKAGALPEGRNIAILGGAGGGSVTMTDLAEKENLRVPHLTDTTIRQLQEFVPFAGNSVKNPLDVFFDKDEDFFRMIELLRDDPNIDALFYNVHIRWRYEEGRAQLWRYIQSIVEAKEKLEKPMFVILEKEGETELDLIKKEVGDLFRTNNIATFPSLEVAARVLYRLDVYRDFLASPER
ncbi:MAG: acetyl-CoA synthetase [Proteobacteria bacterium]|nr:acetyl-CoA synthetase [Pseudomonadota bacterium]